VCVMCENAAFECGHPPLKMPSNDPFLATPASLSSALRFTVIVICQTVGSGHIFANTRFARGRGCELCQEGSFPRANRPRAWTTRGLIRDSDEFGTGSRARRAVGREGGSLWARTGRPVVEWERLRQISHWMCRPL
jgi:hypothetical protein